MVTYRHNPSCGMKPECTPQYSAERDSKWLLVNLPLKPLCLCVAIICQQDVVSNVANRHNSRFESVLFAITDSGNERCV